MAYDLNKWIAGERSSRTRYRWLPWALTAFMLVVAANAVLETFDNGVEARRIPSVVTYFGIIVLMSASPFARDAWLGRRMEKVFDEFELAALSRATTRAYSVLLFLLSAFFSWLWLAHVNGWPMPRTPLDWSSLGFALLAVAVALPIDCAEFMVPPPPEDERSDD